MERLEFARQLRVEQTDAERTLWHRLRNRQLAGTKFRRQQPLGLYFADVYCHELKLVIEIDGGQHLDSAHDNTRDAWLNKQGYRVLRFWNHDVLGQTDVVLEAIWRVISESKHADAPSPPAPLPRGEG
ncbi:endonuclease domain-containing protein [Pseudomonas resinovorans]|uniref:Endonuclease domain-containing protein n=1 Tax=Metapseudomonas resinovorans TaxID=53412 RepID=A0ABT4YCR1_METRE|nr:endonuclease domain-containing protein [Pseudomonas resinovorans]MDA8486695.1 endonuclease domain-containing protein [Pseudomonas resinovorans]